jgi:hypothetical protein
MKERFTVTAYTHGNRSKNFGSFDTEQEAAAAARSIAKSDGNRSYYCVRTGVSSGGFSQGLNTYGSRR